MILYRPTSSQHLSRGVGALVITDGDLDWVYGGEHDERACGPGSPPGDGTMERTKLNSARSSYFAGFFQEF